MAAQVTAQSNQLALQQQLIIAQAAELQKLHRQTDLVAAKAPEQDAQILVLQDNAAQLKLKEQERPRLAYSGGRAAITSSDGRSSLGFRTLVQSEVAHYDQRSQGLPGVDFRRGSVGAAPNRENLAAGDLSDGSYFRRARLGFDGVFNRDFTYRFVAEFAGSGTEGPARINDAWVSYTGFAPFSLQAGAFSVAANMEDGTLPEDTLFLERASPSELSRSMGAADGRFAVSIKGVTPRWMGSLALTGRTVNDPEVFDSQAAVVGRLAHLLLTSDDYNVHVGASGTYVLQPADQGLGSAPRYGIRYRDRPELRVDSTRLIDTGSIDARHAYSAAVEFAAQYKSVLFQTEHFWYGIDRRGGTTLSDPEFQGGYAQASWVITGEPHRYNPAGGAFQAPRPYSPFSASGGTGAWELAARYSELDLNYRAGLAGQAAPADGVRGGDQQIWTLGLNWYPTPNLRFLLDYMWVDVDRLNPASPGNLTPFGAGATTPPIGEQIGQKYNAVAFRSQFSF